MLATRRRSWQNPLVLTTLLLVFLSGTVVGALTMQFGLHKLLHSSGGFLVSRTGKGLSYRQLKHDLSLSPAQADQVKSILDDFVKYNEDLEAQIDDVRATGKNRILSVLDPGQKQKFEKLCAELEPK